MGIGLHEDIHGREGVAYRDMTMDTWILRAAWRTEALVKLHRLNVPEWALWFIAEVAVPQAIDHAVKTYMISAEEAAWVSTLYETEPPWFLRVAVKLWRIAWQ